MHLCAGDGEGRLGRHSAEQLQVVPGELSVLTCGVHVDDPQDVVPGDERRTHHGPNVEVGNAHSPHEALVRHRVHAQDGHAPADRLVDDAAAYGDLLRPSLAVVRRGRHQFAVLIVEHQEAAVGHAEHLQQVLQHKAEKDFELKFRLNGAAYPDDALEPFIGLGQIARDRRREDSPHHGRTHVDCAFDDCARRLSLLHDRSGAGLLPCSWPGPGSSRRGSDFCLPRRLREPEDVRAHLHDILVVQKGWRCDGLPVDLGAIHALEVLDVNAPRRYRNAGVPTRHPSVVQRYGAVG